MHSRSCIEGAQVIVSQRLFPFQSPGRRSWRQLHTFERAPIRLHLTEIAASYEAQGAMIEVVAIELVNAHADCARRDERVEVELVLVEETERSRDRLVREVPPNLTLSRRGIVWLADAGEQKKLHIEQLKTAQNDQIGRLLELVA